MATAKNLANTVRGQEGCSTEDNAILAKWSCLSRSVLFVFLSLSLSVSLSRSFSPFSVFRPCCYFRLLLKAV